MRGPVLTLLLGLAATPAPAQPAAPDAGTARREPSGIFSHGDIGDFVEESYAHPPEPAPPRDGPARRKGEPGLRWDGPATGR